MPVKKKYTLDKPEKKLSRRKKNINTKPLQLNWLIWSGITLTLLGILGSAISYLDMGRRSLAQYLPDETAYYVKIKPSEIPIEQAQLLLNLTSSEDFLQNTTIEDFTPWIGREALMAKTIDNRFIARFRYHNKSAAKKFLTQQLLVPNETWQLTKWSDPDNRWFLAINDQEIFSIPRQATTIYSPKFSNTVSYSFTNGYLWIAADQDLLKDTLTKKNASLQNNSAYQAAANHLAKKNPLEIFISTNALSQQKNIIQQQKTISPLLNGLIDVTPAIVVTANTKKKRFQLQLRLISNKKNDQINLQPLNTPELANFSPDKPILFFTGQDLRAHHQKTNKFLSNLHPQFSDIFNGILQAQAEKTFGKNFDVKADLLSQLSGQYALIIESNLPNQTPNFTLISEFGRSDTAAKIAQFQEALRFAQSKSTARVITVDIPGGREQKQAVNISTAELIVNELPLTHGSVYEVANTNLGTTIYFGFRDQYMLLSTSPSSIHKIFGAAYKPLTENPNFRKTILFEHNPAESYGYISLEEAKKAFDYVFISHDLAVNANTSIMINDSEKTLEYDQTIEVFNQITAQFKSIIFSQKRNNDDLWWEIDFVEKTN